MRLIDADELIEQIWEKHKKTEEPYDFCVDELKEVFCGIVALVDEQPTAYDPDKVVTQLEELRKAEQDRPDDCNEDGCGDGEQIYDDGRSQGRFEAFGKAIQIVKGGGVDGN